MSTIASDSYSTRSQEIAWKVALPRSKKRWQYYFVKRCIDLLLASVLLILISPLMAVVAVLIRLDSPGPILFRQQRMGVRAGVSPRRGTVEPYTFNMIKFRTMYHNVSSDLHRQFVKAYIEDDDDTLHNFQPHSTSESNKYKMVGDPRITRIGRFLRKTSIDELPQLWNVVQGHMSLVGPRPAIPYEVEMYQRWHRRRLEAKPGLTGLWQVTARSSAKFNEMIRLDIAYVDNRSLWLDLKILLSTPAAVFTGKGAE